MTSSPPAPGAQAASLYDRFAQHAETTPERPALSFQGQSLTYAELAARAGRLAVHLRERGVGPDTLVGLYGERSLGLIVGLLGILKAGGAYVPLDPSAPAARTQYLLDDTDAPVIVAQADLARRLPASQTRSIVEIDTGGAVGSPPATVALSAPSRPDALAYVLYTSGSTGRPKGVLVEHRSVLNYVDGVVCQLGLDACSTFAMVQPLTVDSCVTMLYPALLTGGCLHIVSAADASDAERLSQILQTEAIDALKIAPSHLEALMSTSREPGALVPQRCLIVGGEASRRDWAERLQALAPSCAVFNHYGPTEATVGVTTYRVRPMDGSSTATSTLPIGHPLPGVTAYVVDAAGLPVADGTAGELYLGGACLARGYLNRPDLTARAFVEDPFETSPDARLYRTGDRVRVGGGGALEFLGRLDDQVKVNGYRIEPGEVEAALRTHPGVEQAIVRAVEGPGGGRRLAAYVVSPPEAQTPSASALRTFLQETLPPPLVPSAFVALDAMPLTPHGKADVNRLPAPTFGADASAEPADAPQTPTERAVASVWADVLGLPHIGRSDNFFDLGGHSLLAIRVLGRLSAELGTRLALPDLFAAPTVSGLAEVLDRGAGVRPARLALTARDRSGAMPLSFAQQRLWFLAQLDPDSPLYNMAKGFRLRGPLDTDALQRALDALIARHESLRTRVLAPDGEPSQVIDAPAPVRLHRVDLADHPDDMREAALAETLLEDAARPFDLARDPVVRARLVRLGPEEHVLLLTIHHIAFDGLSQIVLVRELAALYTAVCDGHAAALPALAVQYADYAAWHRETLTDAQVQADLTYWTRQLATLPVVTLPEDRERPPQQTHRGTERDLPIPTSVAEPLRALNRDEGTSPFMTLLAAFGTLLATYTATEDVPVGAPIAGRDEIDTDGLVGFFANMVVLRMDLHGDPSFRDILRRVRRSALDAYAHQNTPFERVVEATPFQRDPRYAPLIQVVFALQDAAAMDLALPGVASTPLVIDNGTAKYDVTFDVIMNGETPVSGLIEYNTDLYDEATAQRFLRDYSALLDHVLARPDLRLSEIRSWLTALDGPADARVDRLPSRSLDGAAALGPLPHATLHAWVEAQVERTPDAVAVVGPDGELTYAALDARANRLARRLRTLGVGPDDRVAVLIGRSIDAVVAILATLKAGGAYVPIDPTYPPDRIAFMLDDAAARVALTSSGSPLEVDSNVPMVHVDEASLDALSAAPLDASATADAAAYVIYTSGSSGRPKGVVVEHRQIVHSTFARHAAYDEPVGAFLLLPSFAFDSSVAGLFWTLSTGGTLVLPSDAEAAHPRALARLVADHGVTHTLTVPSFHGLLLDTSVDSLATLRTCIVAGEACPPGLVERHARSLPSARLFNEYGPTEASVWSTVYDTARWPADRAGSTTVPIGEPAPGTRIVLLDDDGRLASEDTGEIAIGGPGVARGYLGRPDLTAERFVEGPNGERLYRTGDRGRRLADGTLLFGGRIDTQVKLRGYRIELEEIEAVLSEHEGVADVAVALLDETSDRAHLAAYVVARRGTREHALVESLRDLARRRLPAYMVPTQIRRIEALPRTPNGKLDRDALRAPPPETPDAASLTEPSTATEARLVAIWKAVLGVDALGVHDDFFDRGGHSLLAVKLFVQVERAFGVSPPLAVLFSAPTVAELAPHLDAAHSAADTGSDAGSATLVPIQPNGSRPALFCVHGYLNRVSRFALLSRQLGPDQPVYGIQGQGLDGRPITQTSLVEMASEYLDEVRAVQPTGPYLFAGFCIGGRLALEMALQAQAAGEEVAMVLIFDGRFRSPGPPPTWQQEYGDHLQRLRDEGAEYLWRQGTSSLKSRLSGLREKTGWLHARARAALAQPIPKAAQQSYVNRTYMRIFYDYTLKPYPGRIVLLTDNADGDLHTDWSQIAELGVERTVFEGASTLLGTPHVVDVARRVREHIQDATQIPH